MAIDFKEIPRANSGLGNQDRFEQFARDFLETIGFEIIRGPDRGPDGKKDLIVSETRKGISGSSKIRWLVSCKHFAHSKRSVKDVDEVDIQDRVENHKCDGFMGFYSTIPASTLSNKLKGLENKIHTITYDNASIEKELLKSFQKQRLLASYFPNSFDFYQSREEIINKKKFENKKASSNVTEDDMLRIAKTAIIILEVDKIDEEYRNSFREDIAVRRAILYKLYRFLPHNNYQVAEAVFSFLSTISDSLLEFAQRGIAEQIKSLIFSYFSTFIDEDEIKVVENGKQCIQIGYDITYEALIHNHDFLKAEYGLLILKYIYRKAKQTNILELTDTVIEKYDELGVQLNRPERNDLALAKDFVSVYRNDLARKGFDSPELPEQLSKLT